MSSPPTYNYLSAYVNDLRAKGRYSFTIPELRQQFALSENALKKALQRSKQKKEIALIRQGFYVVVPPEYRSRGVLPPALFVADLMHFLNRPYYVGLLSAAAYYGAAHQQPQAFFVITTKPFLLPVHSHTLHINFCHRKHLSALDTVDRKTDTGYFKVSSPELTALDLVFFYDRVGGMNRVATVLTELAESLHADQLHITASRYEQIAAVQRLGFLFDHVLDQKKLATPLRSFLKTVKHYPILLRPQKEKPKTMTAANDWKVVPNIDIETDV